MKTNIKTTIKALPLILLSQVSLQALAQVNIKDGSFEKSFDQDIKRHYHSRTLYNGYFGFGWCSELETSLDTSQDRLLKLKDCRLSTEITYRQIYKNTYISAALPEERITYKNGIFTRHVGGKPEQRFDPAGKLTSLMNKKGQSRILAYDRENKLSALTDYQGQIYVIKMDLFGKKIVEISAGAKNNFKYIYHGDDLLEVKKTGTTLYRYDYDRLHNLIQISYGTGKTTKETLRYNDEKDLVVQYTDLKNCQEFYQYRASINKPNDHTFADAQRLCPDEPKKSASYEFFHETHRAGFRFLSKVIIKSKLGENSLDTLEISFDPYSALPKTTQTRRIANDEK